MVKKIIAAVIAIVIGLALLPVVSDFASGMTSAAITDTLGSTLSTAGQFYGTTTGSLIDLLPILFVIILVAGAVGYVILTRNKGE